MESRKIKPVSDMSLSPGIFYMVSYLSGDGHYFSVILPGTFQNHIEVCYVIVSYRLSPFDQQVRFILQLIKLKLFVFNSLC